MGPVKLDPYIRSLAPDCFGAPEGPLCRSCVLQSECSAARSEGDATSIGHYQPQNEGPKHLSAPLTPYTEVKVYAGTARWLQAPKGYRLPAKGKAAEDVQHAIALLEAGMSSMYIAGPSGVGKDALVHFYSAATRRPALMLEINPSTDIEGFLSTRAFDASGTYWEHGVLLKALRDGFERADGSRVPYLILLSDFDRAAPSQMEAFRLILDSIQGRVTTPDGQTHEVLPGTQIVATANSSGGGDTTGRYITAQPIDGSLMNRFRVKLRFSPPDMSELLERMKPNYTVTDALGEREWQDIQKACESLSRAVHQGELFAEFSVRDLQAWFESADIFFESFTKASHGDRRLEALRNALRVYLDGLPDEDAQLYVQRIFDPYFPLLT